jgi:myo-inositol-1-phosphate synthase
MASSGYSTPESELESVLPVHPTAARRPYNLVVNSDKTQYTSDHITSTFVNRGAEVTLVDGAVSVTPTATQYEFQTQRNVNRTGYVFLFFFSFFLHSFLKFSP